MSKHYDPWFSFVAELNLKYRQNWFFIKKINTLTFWWKIIQISFNKSLNFEWKTFLSLNWNKIQEKMLLIKIITCLVLIFVVEGRYMSRCPTPQCTTAEERLTLWSHDDPVKFWECKYFNIYIFWQKFAL